MKPLRNDRSAAPSGHPEAGPGAASSDADLVRGAWRGDKQAFVEIVARNQAMVCGIALGIVGSIAASEDVAQEAFLTAWRKIHELREPESVRAWLRQIARHVALGHQRRQPGAGHQLLDEAQDLPDRAPLPDEQAATEEEAALIREALTQLPEIYREPLILYYRENRSTTAVADALGISEDAVRQRLARGREMLRDRVSNVIENVLSRTRPTGIFTMSVAVAIGALASPSAVASSVFGAAAAASSPAATPFALVKVLLGSKALLWIAAMVSIACIPVGYRWRGGMQQAAIDLAPGEITAALFEAAKSLEPGTSAIFAEWKRLHDLHGTNLEAMPKIYREIAGFRDPARRQGFRAALLAEWIQLNPTNAMAHLRDGTIGSSQRRQLIDEWLAQDVGTALNTFVSNGRGWEAIARAALPELAKRAPGQVPVAMANLPRPTSASDHMVHDAFAILAEHDLASARGSALTIEGSNRHQALAGVARTWGKTDPDGALAWARNLADVTDRDEIIRSALVGAAMSDPVAALDRVGLVPPGGRKGLVASTTGARVLKAGAQVDFGAIVRWLATHPGQLSEEDVLGLANAVGERLNADPWAFLTQNAAAGSLAAINPAIQNALSKESSGQRLAVWEWLKGQTDSAPIRELARHVLKTCGEQNPLMAFQLAEEASRTAEGEIQLSCLADGLLGNGTLLHRLDPLLQQAPQRLRQPLLTSAFRHLTAESLADPHRWIAFLARMPENTRQPAAQSLARAWAERTLEESIGWAASMPAGETRAEILSAIAGTWAAKDSPAASVWVAAMPPGAERDRSAQSLVLAMADEFPREAWDWAISIGDASRRIAAAIHAAKRMAARDNGTAQALIESGPLPSESKAAIQAALVPAEQRRPTP